VKVWIDIENPPQVQYLVPFRVAFERLGADVVVTARDQSFTRDLLDQQGVEHLAVGASAGASRPRKAAAILSRALALRSLMRNKKPRLLLCASRASALAAPTIGVPGFAFCDYEFVDLRFARLARTRIVHPDMIPPEAFTRQGINRGRLMPFRGMKESISLSNVDVDSIAPAEIDGLPPRDALRRVLVRPPAEESHYYRAQSKSLTLELLAHLATRDDAAVVFAPRYEWQAAYVREQDWRVPPVILEHPIPFVPLLKAVDVVVSSGGTMLREAAHLGIPAYSIFRSRIGSVDMYLERTGRIGILRSMTDALSIDLARPALAPLPAATPDDLDFVAARMLALAEA
jgi:predicted glycosyltransferase